MGKIIRAIRPLTLIIALLTLSCIQAQEWSWIHKKIFNITDYRTAQTDNTLTFEKTTHVQPFTWLILSWNADRPQQGNYTFFVQAHDATTNTWTPLYTAAEWGSSKQISYTNKSVTKSTNSQYAHVRLELLNNHYADGFKVVCTASDGASLDAIKMINVNTLNDKNFKPEEVTKKYQSTHIKNVPYKSQFLIKHKDFSVLCSPTATSLLVSYLTGAAQDSALFADGVYDTGLQAYGSWPFNTAHAYEQGQGKFWFYVQRLNSWDDVYKKLIKKIPVVVSVRGTLNGAPKEFPGGHLLLVVGYDAKNNKVLCHDSSALFRYFDKEKNIMTCSDPLALSEKEAIRSYDFNDFIQAWERSFRTAYIAEKIA